MLRCLSDFWGYCTGQPKHTAKKETYMSHDFGGKANLVTYTTNACQLDPKNCGFYRSFTQMTPPKPSEKRRRRQKTRG